VNDNKPKSTEKSDSTAAENLKMEPQQKEQPTKSIAKVAAAIPLPRTSNMDENNNNNTSPTPSTTIEDKNHDGGGVKAPKWGRQSSNEKSGPLAEEILVSPPQKKPANEVNKGMEVCELG
jgi:hypothetical protein